MSNPILSRIDQITPKIFSDQVEAFVQQCQSKNLKTNYIQAILYILEINRLEIELTGELLTPILKEKLKSDAQTLHFIPKTSRLPI